MTTTQSQPTPGVSPAASERAKRARAARPSGDRPLASISLDLDNLWSYMMIHGDEGWQAHPSYLDPLADILTRTFDRHALRMTIFIVGRDAALDKNRAALTAIAAQGHEIGNHSLSHEPWFHEYDRATTEREIGESEDHIFAATGQRPHGFRGPGFSLSKDALEVLAARGYMYDASTFPTFLGPIARAYYFWSTRGMAEAERKKRARLYGTLAEGLRPIDAYAWDVRGRGPGDPLLEIPVTTMPIARLPIHLSYVLYLASYSKLAARAYIEAALELCLRTKTEPSFLLHPLDFISGDRAKEIAFFPGMSLSTDFKLGVFDFTIGALRRRFELVPMEVHAQAILDDKKLAARTLE